MTEDFLKLYNEELHNLRLQGENFAEHFPKIAGRLRLGKNGIEDPLVGRLMEAFAFMTARVRHKLDSGLDNMIDETINLLYPHYLLPIPSCSTLQILPNTQLDTLCTIPAQTVIAGKINEADTCYFTTRYPVKLWPIKIGHAKYQRKITLKPKQHMGKELKSGLSLQLHSCNSEISLTDLDIDSLRFFIKAEPQEANLLYELLLWHTKEIIIKCANDNETVSVPPSVILPVGFTKEEALLSYPNHSFIGYRLLSEFFAFPEKFLYFDLKNLNQYIPSNATEIELYFYFDDTHTSLENTVSNKSFVLGCTPIVNIFSQTGEPITIDQTQTEYHVIADNNISKENIEVYRLQSVEFATTNANNDIICRPYFGRKFTDQDLEKFLYWHSTKKAGWELGEPHLPGYESFISFSNIGYFQDLSNHLVVTPTLLCTNRELPTQLPFGQAANLSFKDNNYEMVAKINCITPITPPKYRDQHQVSRADLASHLFLSQTCFTKNSDTLQALQDNLKLYHNDTDVMITGLIAAETKTVTERHPETLKQGFCKGIELTITIDDKAFQENNAYLFGCVLNEFLTLSCSINSFVKLIVKSKQRGEIYRWKPKLGTKPIL